MYLYGSGMSALYADKHDHVKPADPGGVAEARENLKGGRHIRYAQPTPLANLHLTLGWTKWACMWTRSPIVGAR